MDSNIFLEVSVRLLCPLITVYFLFRPDRQELDHIKDVVDTKTETLMELR